MTSPADQADQIALAAGPAHTRADWEKIAAGVLRKAHKLTADDADDLVWSRLTRTTLDGIGIPPLGTPAALDELQTSGRPGRAGEWDVRAWFADPDPKATAADIQTDLDNGVTSVWLEVGPGGVAVEDLATALAGVLLDVAPVVLQAADPVAAAEAFAAIARGTGLADGTNLGADPLGALARSGAKADIGGIVEAVAATASDLGCRALVVDGTAVHDLGASDVQELGWTIAVGAAYLRLLVAGGRSVEQAADLIDFRYAATDEQFTTIAKLRAARRLWARVLELSGVPTGSTTGTQRQHAVTSRPMMTKYDPWVNMLRTCVAAFAAGVGGADSVTVLPFDSRLGLSDAFGRRIARNTSALLVHESHVAKVADPAGGSYAVEHLTDDVAVAAWAEFQRIEGDGGAEAGLPALRERIDAVVTERDTQIALRKRPLTGLSEFPNLHEQLPERRPLPEGGVRVRPYGAAFEALRDDPPQAEVFLATMGTVAAHTARATFATNLLAAGGIAVVNAGRADDVAGVMAAYSGEPVVCLAGPDAAYAAWGADLVAALRDAGARWVVLAGKPGEKTLDADLVDDSCAVGVDALAFLRRTREKLA
ncbi:MAG TPA: methylmalonyl-CoA mutase family protein [Marmoricola sp.]|nr:methylmalonyl-CoA mutase family protein [Marmoricola sp.]